jgi:hypothetical protein
METSNLIHFFLQGVQEQEARIREMLDGLKRDQDQSDQKINALSMQLSNTVYQVYQEQQQESFFHLHQSLLLNSK